MITGEVLRAQGALQAWSGVRLAHRDPDRSSSPPPREDSACSPQAVQVNGEPTGQSLSVCTPTAEFYWASEQVPAWSLSDAQGLQALRVDIGAASSRSSVRPAMLTNRGLPRGTTPSFHRGGGVAHGRYGSDPESRPSGVSAGAAVAARGPRHCSFEPPPAGRACATCRASGRRYPRRCR